MKCPIFGTAKAGLVGLVSVVLSVSAMAQIYTLSDNNSLAQVDVGSQRGMYNWSVRMPDQSVQNQLNQQWFWYRVGAGGSERSIDTIGAAIVQQINARSLGVTYATADFSIRIDYLLSGGTIGSGVSDIGEQITIRNLGNSTLDFHFFQYSDFNLAATPDNERIVLGRNLRGYFNEAAQTEVGPMTPGLTETVTTPGANHGEAAFYDSTLLRLNDALPTTLNDVAGPLGVGNVTWALEWDLSIAPGGSVIISKDKYLNVPVVPEPSVLALVSIGLAALVMRKRR